MGLKNPDEFMARLKAAFSLTAVTTGKFAPDGLRRRRIGSREVAKILHLQRAGRKPVSMPFRSSVGKHAATIRHRAIWTLTLNRDE